MRTIKQIFCTHWFDSEFYEYEYSDGQIINLEVKTWSTKAERRVCSKCKFEEVRKIGEPNFLGWQ